MVDQFLELADRIRQLRDGVLTLEQHTTEAKNLLEWGRASGFKNLPSVLDSYLSKQAEKYNSSDELTKVHFTRRSGTSITGAWDLDVTPDQTVKTIKKRIAQQVLATDTSLDPNEMTLSVNGKVLNDNAKLLAEIAGETQVDVKATSQPFVWRPIN